MKNTWRFGETELGYLKEVLDSGVGSSTSGDMNKRFEEAFAKKMGVKYAVSSTSGTSTLHAALEAVGVQPGDEVITSPLTVISNGNVILSQNAIPVFADIDADTFNINPVEVEKKITPKTKAIMPVSLYGLACDLTSLNKIAERHNLPIINDAAQAFMATHNNQPITSIADITSYSLENSKHITTGEGGIVVTDSEILACKMRKFGCLGYASITPDDGRVRLRKKDFQDPNYKRHDAFGYNYRMPEVAAAVGLAQLEKIDFFLDLRIRVASLYKQVVADCDYLIPQKEIENSLNTYWCFSLKYERDDVSWQRFRNKYTEFGGDGIYAAWALIYQETLFASGAYKERAPVYYKDCHYEKGICPVAEKIQPKLMQFVNNYGSTDEAMAKVEALAQTINYFK